MRFFCLLLLLCGPFAALRADAPVVIATHSILEDLVCTIGGDAVETRGLVPLGSDPHVFAPRPADLRTLAEADLLVINGLGFEGWLERFIAAADYRGPICVVTEGITPLESADDHADADGHHHEVDPHAWQDPRNVDRFVANLTPALTALAPAQAEAITARAHAYQAELALLDRELRAAFAALPSERRRFVTSHDSLGYLGRAYDLQIIPLRGLSSNREPDARALVAVVRQIRAQNVPAVLVENTANPKLPGMIAEEAGVRLGGTLYTDSLGEPGGPADTYLKMMRTNLATLRAALAE
jgi:zinc/manganese transport system substrate-binding protein